MATHTCNQNCGCTNSYTVTAPCPPSCPEVFNSQCIVYTGTDILCGQDTVIKRYDYLDTVITKLVNYICSGLANVPATVVESDSEYILVTSSTVGNQTTYVLDLDFAQLAADLNLTLPVYNVVGSDNVFVSTSVVGNTTTFTLSGFETEVINSDGLLNVTPNITPGVDIIYTVDVDLVALAAAFPSTSVIQGTSGNTIITTSVVGNLTTYSIDSLETIVAAGNNTTVTASGGGAPNYDTTYTVDAELAIVDLAVGETVLTLVTTPNPGANTTTYTLETDLTVLDTIINTEINDVLDNTVSLFGVDAVYDNLTQTLSVEFIGAAVDGVTITGDGTAGNPLVSVSGSQFTYEIGQYVVAEGGVIAHRWLSTVPNGTPTAGATQNYIVVDLNNLSVSAQWASINVDISNVESTYDGETNTINLIAAGAGSGITVGTAAELCDVSIAGGQTDWYLPAVDELSRLWQNRWEVEQGLGVGGGTELFFGNYWSSTEYGPDNAWYFTFGNGNATSTNKGSTIYVRAVRRFSI